MDGRQDLHAKRLSADAARMVSQAYHSEVRRTTAALLLKAWAVQQETAALLQESRFLREEARRLRATLQRPHE